MQARCAPGSDSPSGAAPASPDAYALSPDDHTVAVGDDSGAVRILDIRSGAVRETSGRHDGAVSTAAFTL